MTAFFSAVLASSAFLTFWVQPLVAKALLPMLGGTPSVWNSCILFFQGMLLLGYFYSHFGSRLSIRTQGVVHALVFIAAIALLPEAPEPWSPPSEGLLVLWVLGKLLAFVGLPFLALSTTAPLLQYWFVSLGRSRSSDPYFLYAASNAGSLLALALFPTVLEPALTLSEQFRYWRWGYLLVATGVLVCYLAARKSPNRNLQPPPTGIRNVGGRRVLTWVVLAIVPSSLMLGVTTHITTDIAAVSYLWVVPLGLYLTTFIVAFSRYGAMAEKFCRLAFPVAALGTLWVSFAYGRSSAWVVPLDIGLVACVSLILHFKLYQARPASSSLTLFYLVISFGGFLGGMLNGLIAPLLFVGVIEYPLVLGMAAVLVDWPQWRRAWGIFQSSQWTGFRGRDVLVAMGLSGTMAWGILGGDHAGRTLGLAGLVCMSMLGVFYVVGARRAVFLLVLPFLVVFRALEVTPMFDPGLHSERTYFGTFRVYESSESGEEVRILSHGTTVHGFQSRGGARSLELRGYYGTLADSLARYLEGRGPSSIAVAGLGAGTLACAGRVGDQVTFMEIDPAVEKVARSYFTYLDRCPPRISVVIGDARQTLGQIENKSYDVVIADAFSGDSIPVHLLTDEAAEIYERVLKDDGLIVLHISNRYLDLKPVLAALASHRGWFAWVLSQGHESKDPLARPSVFVLASRSESVRRSLSGMEGATPLPLPGHFRLWTDDYSNPMAIMRF